LKYSFVECPVGLLLGLDHLADQLLGDVDDARCWANHEPTTVELPPTSEPISAALAERIAPSI
jgi:hypothetical protein